MCMLRRHSQMQGPVIQIFLSFSFPFLAYIVGEVLSYASFTFTFTRRSRLNFPFND
jgi:hypothetical protein